MALFKTLYPFYQFKSSYVHWTAIIAFKLTILWLHKAGDARVVYTNKMTKQTLFLAIPMVPTYHNYTLIVVVEV